MNVDYEMQPVWGVPMLFMSVVRSADVARTPDVRTRAILPEWAAFLTVRFVRPILNETTIANLLVAAGLQSGVGDWRQEKGSGSYGAFTLVDKDNATFNRIIQTQGRAGQIAAMEHPEPYDDETGELQSWFKDEMKTRGKEVTQ